jgi:hypothetical protein
MWIQKKKRDPFGPQNPRFSATPSAAGWPPVLSLAYLGLYEGGRPWCCGITNNKSKLGIVYHWHIGFATLLAKKISWISWISSWSQFFIRSFFGPLKLRYFFYLAISCSSCRSLLAVIKSLLGPVRCTGQILSKLTGQQREVWKHGNGMAMAPRIIKGSLCE